MEAIRHLLHIAAPRHKVYEAITTIEGLSNWWTQTTKGESKPGGIIEFWFGDYVYKMKVMKMEEDRVLQWECIEGASDEWVGTVLTFRLDENEGKTRVRFEHTNWAAATDFFSGCSFTWGRYMESLRQLCQAGKGGPFGSY